MNKMTFKPFSFLPIFTFSVVFLSAQPEDIFGIAKESKTAAFYATQKKLWQAETEKHPANAHAWHMYYAASRAYLQKNDYNRWVNNRADIQAELAPIIAQAKKHINGTFEYFLLESKNANPNQSFQFTKKAYAIDPMRSETYESLLLHYIKSFNDVKATELSKRMLASNYYANANYIWNLNALNTAEEGSIFLSLGDNDTFPRWILQYGANLRTDVKIINLWVLIMDKNYQDALFKKLNIKPFSKSRTDFKSDLDLVNALMVYIMKNANVPVYVNCGVDVTIFKQAGIEDNMFVVGSALTYCKKDLDHVALLRKNFETVYNLEYITHDFQSHVQTEHIKQMMNLSYIPGLINLCQHYKSTGEEAKLKQFEAILFKIAEDSGRKSDVLSWYNK